MRLILSSLRRSSVLYSLPLVMGGSALLWVMFLRAAPNASAQEHPFEAAAQDLEPAAREPAQLPPTGGPYVSPGAIRGAAYSRALAHNVENPQLERVLAMTYGEAVRWNRSGTSALLHPDREVYVVSVRGGVVVRRTDREPASFSRSYYIFDATTGKLVQWGATNLPEPEEDVRGRER